MVQMTNGDTFVTDLINIGELDGVNIQAITLQSEGAHNWGGWFANQSVDGAAVVCFAKGTLIDTPAGPRAIETLVPGDPVCTEEGGALPVLWISDRVAPCRARTAPGRDCRRRLGRWFAAADAPGVPEAPHPHRV